MKSFFLIWLKGLLMGTADIIPGVSGGTMALITNIYERFINALKSFNKTAIKLLFSFKIKPLFTHVDGLFLITLFLGILCALIFFSRIISLQDLMYDYPEWVYGLFFGLIAGSIIILIQSEKIPLISYYNSLLFIGLIIGLIVAFIVPKTTPTHPLFIFFSGFVAIVAMLLPGVSGSYILLLFGKYQYMLNQFRLFLSEADLIAFLNIAIFGIGCVAGIWCFSHIIGWLFKHHRRIIMLVLIGFLIGSLYTIWPYQIREYSEIIVSQEAITRSELDALKPEDLATEKQDYFKIEYENDIPYIVHIRRNLTKSTPYIPFIHNTPLNNIWQKWSGIFTIIIGLLLSLTVGFWKKLIRQ